MTFALDQQQDLLPTDDLCFFSAQVDHIVAALCRDVVDGRALSVDAIAQKYLNPGDLEPEAHATGLALMFATAVVRLVGATMMLVLLTVGASQLVGCSSRASVVRTISHCSSSSSSRGFREDSPASMV